MSANVCVCFCLCVLVCTHVYMGVCVCVGCVGVRFACVTFVWGSVDWLANWMVGQRALCYGCGK